MKVPQRRVSDFMEKRNYILIAVLLFCVASITFASETSGTISDSYKTTYICKNETCSTYGIVNWKPTLNAQTTGATAVTITDSGITGWLWGSEIGWVNMSPTGSGVTINSTTGVLSGYAYANTGSWINFSPTTSGAESVGVTIDSNGKFFGWAYVSGLNGGWMKFDCSTASTCIETDWRPVGARTAVTASSHPSNGPLIWSIITDILPFLGKSDDTPKIPGDIAAGDTKSDTGGGSDEFGNLDTYSTTTHKSTIGSSDQTNLNVKATPTVSSSKTLMIALAGILLVIIAMIVWKLLFMLL